MLENKEALCTDRLGNGQQQAERSPGSLLPPLGSSATRLGPSSVGQRPRRSASESALGCRAQGMWRDGAGRRSRRSGASLSQKRARALSSDSLALSFR